MKWYGKVGLVVTIVLLATVSLVWAGSRSTAWLGVYTQSVDADLADAFALSVDHGAIVNEVVKDSPADEAGLREDDIIISLGSDRIRDDEDLIDLVSDQDPGDEVVLKVLRDGKEKEIKVILGKRPRSWRWHDDSRWFSSPRAPRAPKAPRVPKAYSYYFDSFDHEYPYIGVTLLEVSKRTAESLGADGFGVLIDDVEEDSPAEKGGLIPGDLIVAIDDEEVYEPSDIQDIIRSLDEGDMARVEIVRNHDRATLEVEVELDEGGTFYGGPGFLRLPDLPDIDFSFPRMKGLRFGHSLDLDYFDSEEFREEMEELEKEMARLKKELRNLKKSLE